MSAVPHLSADELGTSVTAGSGSTALEMYPSSCCARDLASAGSGMETVFVVVLGETSWVLSYSWSQLQAAWDQWEVKEPGALQFW